MQDSLKIEVLQRDETGVLNSADTAVEELMLPSDLEDSRAETEEKGEEEVQEEDKKRKEHEASEARRKEEWGAKQQAKKKAEQEQLDRLKTMDNDEVMAASMKRVNADTERLTRRNMKECVSEHIQTLCLESPDFARLVMHPRKNMIHCFRYIYRRAKDFIEQEMKNNNVELTTGLYGEDVPDELCYQWAEDYFRDLDAEEDKEKEEKFVSRQYHAKTAGKPQKAVRKKTEKKQEPEKQEVSAGEGVTGQLMLDFLTEVKAG